ncbi:EIF4E2 [Symbiodinium natans]|uniref:EIF4E2 protein n=1 Tax=Symbiodinium natans TaxID=878477 RepID=A0A812KF79_9DINO|nr:EIF4E2 [Symbiodinium natans]
MSVPLPLAMHLKAVETALRETCRGVSWLVWWVLMFEVLSGFGILALPFLMNEYVYMGGLLLLVLMKLVQKVPVLALLRQPALLAATSRQSMFRLSQEHESQGPGCAWEAAFRLLLSSVAFVSLGLQWSSLATMCTDQPSWEEAYDSAAAGCILPACHTDAVWEALLSEYTPSANMCLIRLRTCHCTQRAGIHTNLCYSLGPIFCSTGLDGAPHALLQRVSILLCAMIAPPLWFLLYLCLQMTDLDADLLRSAIHAEKQKMLRAMQTSGAPRIPSWTGRAWLTWEVAFYLLDIMLDVSCLSTLVQTKQYLLAGCQACVLLWSLVQQLRFGVCAIAAAIRESFQVGYQTDVLLRVLQSEKLSESFLSLLIQGTAITSLRNAAATQFNLSMLISILGIVRAIYKQVHLELGSIDKQPDGTCAATCCRHRRDTVSEFHASHQRGGSAKPQRTSAPALWRNLYGRVG